MDLEWTLGADTRLRNGDQRSFREQVAAILAEGRGYVEVGLFGVPYPCYALSVSDGYGIVHRFDGPESCWLLNGQGILADDDVRLFPVQGDECPFTGGFVCRAQRAVEVVLSRLHGDGPDDPDAWTQM